MQLTGMHHVTAITARLNENLQFYAETLGMRLVKKTVNQDDVSAYHLFYGDGRGTPGSDITFFVWPLSRARRGVGSVDRIGLRVGSEAALNYWHDRLAEKGVSHSEIIERGGRLVLDLEDPEGQVLQLVDDKGQGSGEPWTRSPVPTDYQIRGLGPPLLLVRDLAPTEAVLTTVLGFKKTGEYLEPLRHGEGVIHVFETSGGGAHAEVHLTAQPEGNGSRQGAGAVHHIAFRVPTFEDYGAWDEHLRRVGVRSSGPIDRFYFKSLYFREPGGILFELATDEPGFSADEPVDHLGERLSLPPFLEHRREEIEQRLEPIGVRS
jgi:glyoxalase family protein